MTFFRCMVAVVAAVTLATPCPPPVSASTPARASGSDQPAGKHCVVANEASVRAAGDGGGELKFSAAFFRRVFTLEVSLDGADGNELPMSIETICDVPKKRKKEAAQLAGSDGIARVSPRTQIWQGNELLTGASATRALDGADTARVRARLTRPHTWGQDEDGNAVPTFRAGGIEVTD
jgi:hypothetical protein